jgi:hypothetical protein
VSIVVDVQTVSIVVATASVVVGVVFAVLQLRDFVKTRQTDLIMRLYSRYGSEGFQKSQEKLWKRLGEEGLNFHDYVEKYGSDGLVAEWVTVGTFFEGVGILLYRKLINIGLVDDLFTAPTKMAWDRMKNSIIEARKEYCQPTIFEWFEYLYSELVKRERQK